MSVLQRRFGFNTVVAVVIGVTIGSGIYMKPALMAAQLGSPMLLLSVWVVAGILTLFGALSSAELAALHPEAGGAYIYFRRLYGEGFAFLFSWAAFAVLNSAGAVAVAYVFASYANAFVALPDLPASTVQAFPVHLPGIGTLLPLENIGEKGLTLATLVLFTVLNYFSAAIGGGVQRFLSALKLVAMGVLIFGILVAGHRPSHSLFAASAVVPEGWGLLGAYIAALGGAFWAYDGWIGVTYIGGEVKDPQRNIPRGLFVGLSICMLIYVLVNIAYLYALPVGAMASSSMVATDAVSVVWGAMGGGLVAALVMLSTLGAASSIVISQARVTYATGADQSRLAWVGRLRPGSGTPGNALVLHIIWMALLVFSGTFDMLTDMVVFVSWFYYGMLALGVIIMRIRQKEVDRPYKVPGYPWVPGIFVVFTVVFLVITLWSDVTNYFEGKTGMINSVFGVAITCIGIPLYYWSKKRQPS